MHKGGCFTKKHTVEWNLANSKNQIKNATVMMPLLPVTFPAFVVSPAALLSSRPVRSPPVCKSGVTGHWICAQQPPPQQQPSPQSPTVTKLLDELYGRLSSATTTEISAEAHDESTCTSSESSTSASVSIPTLISDIETRCEPQDLTKTSLIKGTWRILSTTRPTTASIIQRTILSYIPIVDQLILSAVNDTSSDAQPKYIITRVNLSKLFGRGAALNLKAVIKTIDENRIYLCFDSGWFNLLDGTLKLPYPVPFKLLGKKACGWQDITVLTEKFRFVRGNKGTCFVLRKIADGDEDADLFPVTDDVLEACKD